MGCQASPWRSLSDRARVGNQTAELEVAMLVDGWVEWGWRIREKGCERWEARARGTVDLPPLKQVITDPIVRTPAQSC